MKTIKLLLFILAIPIGVFLFVYGEYDDSPGGQLFGLVLALIGIVGIIMRIKEQKENP